MANVIHHQIECALVNEVKKKDPPPKPVDTTGVTIGTEQLPGTAT